MNKHHSFNIITMSNVHDDLGCAIIKFACPICLKPVEDETSIALGTRFSKANAERVNSMNNQIVGFAKKPCKECQEIIDKNALFIIGIDIEKSEKDNPYRSGHIVAIKRESEFVQHLPEDFKKRDAIMMDYREMIQLGMIQDTNQ